MSTNGQAKVLTHDEITRLFGAMDSPRDKALFGIMIYCGLRVSEAISLRRGLSSNGTETYAKAESLAGRAFQNPFF